MRNFILETQYAYHYREGKSEDNLKVYNDCATKFAMIHILNIIAYTEVLKAIDIIDERGMRKQVLKKMLGLYEKRYDTYVGFIRKNMKADVWPLLQDYGRLSCDNIEGKTNSMRQACYNYLKKKGVAEAKLLAQCEVGMILWKIATDTFKVYFERYFDICGVDFSKDFAYADLSLCKDWWIRITNELMKGLKGIDFNEDRRCRDAWNDLKDAMNNTDFFEDAARDALRFNKGLIEKYVPEHAEK